MGRAVALLVLVLAASAHAQAPLPPDPALSPAAVVRIQLEALQRNDVPTPDAGIRQTWAFAHPDNKRLTGPLARFGQMIKGPAYRPLIGHAAHTIERLGATGDEATFRVTIETPEGAVLEYLWVVARVLDGPAKGAWMTTSVPPPRPSGRAI